MRTLKQAWDWYQSAYNSLRRIERMGQKYWDKFDWQSGTMSGDNVFRTLEAEKIKTDARESLKPLEDLAVLALFSVFEGCVRDFLERAILPEKARLQQPILKEVAEDALEGIKEGSFYQRVLVPLRNQKFVSGEVVEHVNQVRKYRNWVAHGRRPERELEQVNITANDAYVRLSEFLETLGIALDPERPESETQ